MRENGHVMLSHWQLPSKMVANTKNDQSYVTDCSLVFNLAPASGMEFTLRKLKLIRHDVSDCDQDNVLQMASSVATVADLDGTRS